jgi:hypothetical protein
MLDLMSLLLGPKRFLADQNAAPSENLTKALLFSLVSSVVAPIFRAYGLESPTDFKTLVVNSAVAWGVSLLVTAFVIAASWSIVRRPVAVQPVLLTQAYILAITIIIANVSLAAEAQSARDVVLQLDPIDLPTQPIRLRRYWPPGAGESAASRQFRRPRYAGHSVSCCSRYICMADRDLGCVSSHERGLTDAVCR